MLVAERIIKSYGSVKAVKGVSFNIKRGEVFGLLGPNGAGKTTTIKMFTALTKPDSGRCIINGHDVASAPEMIKPLIGVVPQVNNLDKDLTAYENLHIYSLLHKVSGFKNKIPEALKKVELYDRRNHLVSGFSGGMQRRLLLARALLPEPEVLFLDEPSIGLDPQIRRGMWDTIRKTRYQGRTVIITTHYIEEAEALCDRVGVMRKGELIALGTPAELKASVGEYVVEYTGAEGRLMQEIKCTKDEAYSEAKKHNGIGVSIRRSNLEDVFIKLTGERIE
ncbi:MAG TPA: ATP-binding cassette domain-containing protein [Spirochaetota bacterium]|nr:ATP-binding cassette domain-containing protein [Spirochaetota bacterium]HPJ35778.1 ATP-binding cassette domain-containing protein [Spirochaetota bacterium]